MLKFAIISSARTIAEWSQALPPWAAQALNSACAMAVLGNGVGHLAARLHKHRVPSGDQMSGQGCARGAHADKAQTKG